MVILFKKPLNGYQVRARVASGRSGVTAAVALPAGVPGSPGAGCPGGGAGRRGGGGPRAGGERVRERQALHRPLRRRCARAAARVPRERG